MIKKVTATLLTVTLAVGATVGLSGCTPGNNVGGATATGAALGGVLGAAAFGDSWVGILGGALVGGIVGNQIGQSMDRRDAERAREVYSSESGQGHWRNERTGYEYTIKPVKKFRSNGRQCREYQTTARIGGKVREVYGRACLMPDGSWQVAR